MARKKKPPADKVADIKAKLSRGGKIEDDVSDDGPKALVKRRHPDWWEHQIKWRWLQDSYEGGQRYREAAYGFDRKGMPNRNLLRHRREYPDPQQFPSAYMSIVGTATTMMDGSGGLTYGPSPGQIGASPGQTAQDDEYESRRSRTPVPEFVAEAVNIHLSKVYDQEVHREGPEELMDWWTDVDGRGTPIDEYMQGTLAPLLMTCATLDVILDRPILGKTMRPPANLGEEQDQGLHKCVISYILPENTCWWRADNGGNFTECLIREWHQVDELKQPDKGLQSDAVERFRSHANYYRHWTETEWVLYNADGSEQIDTGPNEYGYIPIVRLIDQQLHRQPMIGKSRYERIASLQNAYYNVDSELTLSNTLQALPLLSGPEDFLKSDNTLSIGPNYILPKKKSPSRDSYEGWEYVSPPKDPAASLRQTLLDYRDEVDRAACLTKPAGVTGTGGSTVAQSGASKTMDAHTGDKLLTSLAKMLAKTERVLAERAWRCLTKKPLTKAIRESIRIAYPGRFQLFGATELGMLTQTIQNIASMAGALPILEGTLLESMAKSALPGLPDVEYEAIEAEIKAMMETRSGIKEQKNELDATAIQSQQEAMAGQGSEEQDAGVDPTGKAGGTAVGTLIGAQV